LCVTGTSTKTLYLSFAVDIKECAMKLDKCHQSSQCINHVGGYSCSCPLGFRKNSRNVCEGIFKKEFIEIKTSFIKSYF
jgi:hypothetical protein